MPVADSVADSIQTSSANRKLATSCWLPFQIWNGQYKINDSETSHLPIPLSIRYRQVQRIASWELAAGCRFRYETDNISSTIRQLATSCLLPIQSQIRYRQVQRIGNWQLDAGCRFIFEIDNISSTNRQLETSCRLPIQIRNGQYKFIE